MLRWAIVFLIVAAIAGVLGFTTVAGAAMGVAKILFFLFVVVAVMLLIGGLAVGKAITR